MQRALDHVVDSIDPLYDWHNGPQSLWAKTIFFNGARGAVVYYENPPVHQVSSEGLSAYQEAFERIARHQNMQFVLLLSSCDPLHVGGDLKETRLRLEDTQAQVKDLPVDDPARDSHYHWADERLEKAFTLYQSVRSLARDVPIIALCGGGTRYGGSAEIALWADTLIGDSRSAMCFSEATIGLIPGWGGVGRLITKAGLQNALYMTQTAGTVAATDLLRIGLYDEVVEIEAPIPQRRDIPSKDEYAAVLGEHTDTTLRVLLPRALMRAVRPHKRLVVQELLGEATEFARDVDLRSDPLTYSSVWGKSLRELSALLSVEKPLAPQSIAALEELFATYNEKAWNEEAFVRLEMELDAALYRDERLHRGITATLEGHVANFSEKEGSGKEGLTP